jgi:hypothetical protein
VWSWLSSPAVAFISFISALIAIVQGIYFVFHFIHESRKDEGRKHIAAIGISILILIVVIAIASLSWIPTRTAAMKSGSGGVIGEIYPFSMDAIGVECATQLLFTALRKRRPLAIFWWPPIVAITFEVRVYLLSFGTGWVWKAEIAVVGGMPTVSTFLVMIIYFKIRYGEDQTVPSSHDSEPASSS